MGPESEYQRIYQTQWNNGSEYGLHAFTINFQGGSPEGYSAVQPWENNAFEANGDTSKGFCNKNGTHC